MILTVTANPSIDRALRLAGALERGAVQPVEAAGDEAGGKGANVAKALAAAGVRTVAVLPADAGDPYLALLHETGVMASTTPAGRAVRVNLTVTEPDGTTTKLNEPGALDEAGMDALRLAVVERAPGASWVVLSGSLPAGADPGWYAELLPRLAAAGARAAVDTSGAPLAAVLDAVSPRSPIGLLKPNAEELHAALVETGIDPACPDGETLESDAIAAAAAAARLRAARPGLGAVLLTLGARGAVLVDDDGAWTAAPPPTIARSTVGAGDSALAGWLIAEQAGGDSRARLATAVAYGSAAAALPGSTAPRPDQTIPTAVVVTALPAPAADATATP